MGTRDIAGEAPALEFAITFIEKTLWGGCSPCQTLKVGHPPRIPVQLRWEQSVIYFVTICVKHRKCVLANESAFKALKSAAAKLEEWRVLAAILMPDHLHAVVASSKRDAKLGNFSAALKRWMRKGLNASWQWQPGSFDRLLRSNESLHEKWLYLQENPVRAGLV